MKTNIALAIAACTLTSQAVNINVTHHDANQLTFNIANTGVPGYDQLTQSSGNIPYVTYADITAFARQGHVVEISVVWTAPGLNLNNSFTSIPLVNRPLGYDSETPTRIAPNTWEYTYVRPGGPIDLNYVPDNGSVLAGLGVALLGLWRLKR
jgi:hypothetical protein